MTATEMIDEALKAYGSRDRIEGPEVVNLLLDIRQALKPEELQPPSPPWSDNG